MPGRKLSDQTVRDIRFRVRYRAMDSRASLAQECGVSRSYVDQIVNGQARRSAGGPVTEEGLLHRRDHDDAWPASVLQPDEAREIRERYFAGHGSYRKLAEDYPVSPASVENIIKGRTWQNVGGPIKGEDYDQTGTTYGGPPKQFTEEEVRQFRQLYFQNEHMTQADLADRLGISFSATKRMLDGQTYPEAGGPLKNVDYRVARDGRRIEV